MKSIPFFFKCSVAAALMSRKQEKSGQSSVFSWGLNTSGQLGIGSEISQALPQLIEELQPQLISSISSSPHCNSSVALSDSGSVFTWGYGLDGILGHEDTDSNILVPASVEALEGKRFVKTACGSGHMAALTDSGELITWGLDDSHQCGHIQEEEEKNSRFFKPQAFKGGKPPQKVPLENVKDVSCGRQFTAAITHDGSLFTWGLGRDFALGHGTKDPIKTPTKVQALQDVKINKVCCGRNFVVALDQHGNVYTWGNNYNGQLGVSQMDKYKEVPTKNKILKDIVDIQAGDFHVLALDSHGTVYSWGAGGDGQLAHGNTANQSTPKAIHGLPKIACIASGGGHSAFITQDFQVLMCGRGRDGQLGRQGKVESMASYRTSPVSVDYFSQWKVLQVTCGAHHTLALAVSK